MALEYKDYYKILGVSKDAGPDEIRKAFRKLARQYHPDVAKDKEGAAEKFKEINEAYEVLGDPEKRRRYDSLGSQWQAYQSGKAGFGEPFRRRTRRSGRGGETFEFHFGGTGFSDFFEQFFGGSAWGGRGGMDWEDLADLSGGGGAARERAQRGEDVESDLLVTLHEVWSGAVRSLTLKHRDPRTGRVDHDTFRVRIPAGVRENQRIRVPGKGGIGPGGGKPGDLFLRVRFARHPDFRVEGSDLYYDLPLAPWEAVLGAQVKIPTLEGKVELRIPAGTRQAKQLRLRGRGLPMGGGRRGDLFAVINIAVPEHVSEEERAQWEKLAEKSNFEPRSPSPA